MKDKILIFFVFILIIFGIIFSYPFLRNTLNSSDNTVTTEITKTDNVQNFSLEIILADNTKTTYSVNLLPNNNLIEILTIFSNESTDLTFETETSSFGDFITTINGIKAEPSKEFWNFKVNGTDSSVGIGEFIPQKNDTITFSLIKF